MVDDERAIPEPPDLTRAINAAERMAHIHGGRLRLGPGHIPSELRTSFPSVDWSEVAAVGHARRLFFLMDPHSLYIVTNAKAASIEAKPNALGRTPTPVIEKRKRDARAFRLAVVTALWEAHCQTLKDIKEAGGSANLPVDYPTNPELARWLDQQRRAQKRGALSPDSVSRLEALGVVWTTTRKKSRS